MHNVEMLQRQEMLNVKAKSLNAGGDRFTQVQEMKQYCSGQFFGAVLNALEISQAPMAMIDLLGHDATPACNTIGQFAMGNLA